MTDALVFVVRGCRLEEQPTLAPGQNWRASVGCLGQPGAWKVDIWNTSHRHFPRLVEWSVRYGSQYLSLPGGCAGRTRTARVVRVGGNHQ